MTLEAVRQIGQGMGKAAQRGAQGVTRGAGKAKGQQVGLKGASKIKEMVTPGGAGKAERKSTHLAKKVAGKGAKGAGSVVAKKAAEVYQTARGREAFER